MFIFKISSVLFNIFILTQKVYLNNSKYWLRYGLSQLSRNHF